jgi:hypothetical protein
MVIYQGAHIDPRLVCGVQNSVLTWFYYKTMQEAVITLNHENVYVWNIGQGEAQHRKYKGLKLGGGQAHDWSSV